jgi:hypothetical protein
MSQILSLFHSVINGASEAVKRTPVAAVGLFRFFIGRTAKPALPLLQAAGAASGCNHPRPTRFV